MEKLTLINYDNLRSSTHMKVKFGDLEIIDINFASKKVNEEKTETFDFEAIKPVPDSIRGILFSKDDTWKFRVFTTKKNYKSLRGIKIPEKNIKTYMNEKYPKSDYKRLIIVLESPSRYEYFLQEPLLSAQAATGCGVDFYLTSRKFIENFRLDKRKKYVVLLVNPIQYQCSCHMILERHRLASGTEYADRNGLKCNVFKKFFCENVEGAVGANLRKCFNHRLETYSPEYIVNCCTKDLKPLVEEAINDVKKVRSLQNALVQTDTHLSKWWK